MDSILEKNDCIIYSFGLAADWTFEDMMDMMGTFTTFKIHFCVASKEVGPNLKPYSEIILSQFYENSKIKACLP